MEEFKVSEKAFQTLKKVDLSDIKSNIMISDIDCSFKVQNLRDLLRRLNDEIVLEGLTEDQEEANEYGIELYRLYDEIIYQRDQKKKNQSQP